MRSAPAQKAVWTNPTMPRWLTSVPLARPVVPLVNRIRTGSSSAIGEAGSPSAGVASRSAKSSSMSSTVVPSGTGREPLESFGVAEDDLRLRELGGVLDLGRGPPPVVGRGDGAQRGDGEEPGDPLGPVGGEDPDHVAGLHPAGRQSRRDRGDLSAELGVGDALVAQDHELVVAVPLGVGHHVAHRSGPVGEHLDRPARGPSRASSRTSRPLGRARLAPRPAHVLVRWSRGLPS